MKEILRKIAGFFTAIPTDKWMHFALSAMVAVAAIVAVEWFLPTWPEWVVSIAAIAAVLAVGLVKELVVDQDPDPWDMVANMFGAGIITTTYLAAL